MVAVQPRDTDYPLGEGFTPPARVDSGLDSIHSQHEFKHRQIYTSYVAKTEQTESLNNVLNNHDASTRSNSSCRQLTNGMSPDREIIHRRDSVATSSGSSNKRSRKHRANSRRPSTHAGRPTMSRSNSSYGPSPPQMSIQEAINIHRRCTSLFQNPAVVASTPTLPQNPSSAPCSPRYEHVQPMTSAISTPGSMTPYTRSPHLGPTILDAFTEPEELEEQYEPIPPTTIHWTSAETRRKEYAEIDRMHTGIRGFWQRVAPRWLCPRVRAKFYDEKDENDANSIRRHRIDITADDEEEEISEKAENQRPKVKRSVSCF